MKVCICKNEIKTVYICIIFFTSASFVLFTALSLIFFNVPDYIYLNIIGIFIFTVYFGFLPAVLYLLFIQYLMMKFGLISSFYNYSLMLGFINVLIISLCTKKKKIDYIGILVASVIMAVCSNVFSIKIYGSISNTETIDFAAIMSFGKIIRQFRIYIFSGLCTSVFFYIFNISCRRLK